MHFLLQAGAMRIVRSVAWLEGEFAFTNNRATTGGGDSGLEERGLCVKSRCPYVVPRACPFQYSAVDPFPSP